MAKQSKMSGKNEGMTAFPPDRRIPAARSPLSPALNPPAETAAKSVLRRRQGGMAARPAFKTSPLCPGLCLARLEWLRGRPSKQMPRGRLNPARIEAPKGGSSFQPRQRAAGQKGSLLSLAVLIARFQLALSARGRGAFDLAVFEFDDLSFRQASHLRNKGNFQIFLQHV